MGIKGISDLRVFRDTGRTLKGPLGGGPKGGQKGTGFGLFTSLREGEVSEILTNQISLVLYSVLQEYSACATSSSKAKC
jgi:hypothetical protein